MKKRNPIMSEKVPEHAVIEDVLPYLADLEPSGIIPLPSYSQQEGESDLDFEARKVADILVQFYELAKEKIECPICVAPEITRPGLSIKMTSPNLPLEIILSMDYPAVLLTFLEADELSMGCRLSLINLQLEDAPLLSSVPNPVKELPNFFKELPAHLNYAPWQVSPLSNSGITIYEAILIAPKKLHYHFAADRLAQVIDWLAEKYSC